MIEERGRREESLRSDALDVFIHFDSEDRIIATILRPHFVVGQFNLLRVASVEKVGAFMDWGLSKNLLVPFGEQRIRLQANRFYIVYGFIDEGSGRVVGSIRISDIQIRGCRQRTTRGSPFAVPKNVLSLLVFCRCLQLKNPVTQGTRCP